MKLSTLLASSAALAAITLVVPATVAPSWNPVASAEAATSISLSVFYDGLDNEGDWIDHDGDYVFVPTIADADWQPYTRGHWVYARGIGWTWASDEPFGWATYHYGRWGFEEEIGWYWIPGSRWAPAWVSWRRGGDHVAWAPLPPRRGGGDDVSISVNVSSIPDYYWVAVPSRSFLEVNLNSVIVEDVRERRRIVTDSEFVGSVQVENNIVINNVININYIEENTGQKVKEVAVRETDDPSKAKATQEQIVVFNGVVEADKTAKPSRIKEVSAVKENQAETKKKLKLESAQPAEAAPATAVPPAAEDTAGANKAGTEQGQATGTTVDQPAAVVPTPETDQNKGTTTRSESADTPAATTNEKPGGKKSKVDQTEDAAAGAATGTESADTPVVQKNKKAVGKKPKADQTEATTTDVESADPPAASANEKAAGKKSKGDKNLTPDTDNTQADTPPAKKKKVKAEQVQTPGSGDDEANSQSQSTGKMSKGKDAAVEGANQSEESQATPKKQPAENPKKDKRANPVVACDPATESCAQ